MFKYEDKKNGRGKGGSSRCSFCGKGQGEVQKLIAGPNVSICDECIHLCNLILNDEAKKQPQKAAGRCPLKMPLNPRR